jgi:anti-sigma factor RsiW
VKVLWRRERVVCQQWVELVTAYLDSTLPRPVTKAIDRHLAHCRHCREYLKQMRLTIRLTGELRDEDVPDEVIDALEAAFRDLQNPQP